jgi:molybdopterin-guanine dinucleotide biosynthesis protein A
MGRDKASLPFAGETLLGHAARRLFRWCEDVIVVARPEQDLPPLPAGVRVVRDERPEQGPLGGLAPGLRAAASEHVFATACDVPFLSGALVEALFTAAEGHDVAVCEADGHTQPLTAVYRSSLAGAIDALLDAGRRRPVFLYEEADTRTLREAEVRRHDPRLRSFENCNREDAYEQALVDYAASPPRVRIELFEMARRIADAPAVNVEAHNPRQALRMLAQQYPKLVPDVLTPTGLAEHWRLSLGGKRFLTDLDLPLETGDDLVLVSALAGG